MIWITRSLDLHSDNIITTTATNVRAYVLSLKISGHWGPAPLGWGVADYRKHSPLRMCYRTKYRCSKSNRLGAGRDLRQFQGRWGPPSWDADVVDP